MCFALQTYVALLLSGIGQLEIVAPSTPLNCTEEIEFFSPFSSCSVTLWFDYLF